jgi:hypothetical protein
MYVIFSSGKDFQNRWLASRPLPGHPVLTGCGDDGFPSSRISRSLGGIRRCASKNSFAGAPREGDTESAVLAFLQTADHCISILRRVRMTILKLFSNPG